MAAVNSNSPFGRRIFASVFPPTVHATPTPEVSPAIGFPLSPVQDQKPLSTADSLARRNVAWSAVTRWLGIANNQRTSTASIDASLIQLLDESGPQGLRNLQSWFEDDIRKYFEQAVVPDLRRIWRTAKTSNNATFAPKSFQNDGIPRSEAEAVLQDTVRVLLPVQNQVISPLVSWLAAHGRTGQVPSSDEARLINSVEQLRNAALHRLRSLVQHTLPSKPLLSILTYHLHQVIGLLTETHPSNSIQIQHVGRFLHTLTTVGLGADIGQKSLAFAVKAVIETFVNSPKMKIDWIGRSSRIDELREWIEKCLEPAVKQCLICITDDPSFQLKQSDRDQWQRMAINSLGRSREKYLLQYVQMWDQSMGAILDLKEYIKTPEAKNALATAYCTQMERGIAHAGAKTSELLSIYVNMIKVFRTLDNRGVLLEKVAHPLRVYLRERDDTVRVIAASFLADVDDGGADAVNTPGVDDVCVEIAREVLRSEDEDVRVADKALDYDDMEWMPDPIDAGPDFKNSKSNDTVSYMLSLFEQESFIKEVQNILGERLLRSEDSDLEKETRLVELFKSRLGQDKLQQCEVMLRDMQDSSRIMNVVRNARLNLPTVQEVYNAIPEEGTSFSSLAKHFARRVPQSTSAYTEFTAIVREAAIQDPAHQMLLRNPALSATSDESSPPKFYAQVLSSFFWPELRDDTFAMPAAMSDLQNTYEQTFTRIKNLRTLRWLSALGRASIELELEDRTLNFENVHTWQASVIYAFQAAGQSGDGDVSAVDVSAPVEKTVDELSGELDMDDVLVRNAISFWVSNDVLVKTSEDTYMVLESLSQRDATLPSKSTANRPEEEIGAVKSQNAVLKSNKDMYQMFMIGMLTNGGAMDAGRVGMMMKMVVPGGFNFGDEEVRWLLGDLVEQGRATVNGEVYAANK